MLNLHCGFVLHTYSFDCSGEIPTTVLFVSSVNELINVKRLITRELTSKGHVDLNQQCGNEGGVFMTFFIGERF